MQVVATRWSQATNWSLPSWEAWSQSHPASVEGGQSEGKWCVPQVKGKYITKQWASKGIALTLDPFVHSLGSTSFQQQVSKALSHFEVGWLVAAEICLLQPRCSLHGINIALWDNLRFGGQISLHKMDPRAQERAEEFEQVGICAKVKLFGCFLAPGAASIQVAPDTTKGRIVAIKACHLCCVSHAFKPYH